MEKILSSIMVSAKKRDKREREQLLRAAKTAATPHCNADETAKARYPQILQSLKRGQMVALNFQYIASEAENLAEPVT